MKRHLPPQERPRADLHHTTGVLTIAIRGQSRKQKMPFIPGGDKNPAAGGPSQRISMPMCA